MSIYILDFENPLREIENKIDALKSTGIKTGMDVSDGIKKLEALLSQMDTVKAYRLRILLAWQLTKRHLTAS